MSISNFVNHKKLFTIILITIGFSTNIQANEANLGQLTLVDAKNLLIQYNKELSLAKEAIEAANADKSIANQKTNPTLTLSSRNFSFNHYGNRNPSNNSNSIGDQTLDNTIQINQLIERGDKRNLRTMSAEDAINAAKFDFDDTVRQNNKSLESAYFDLVLAQETVKIQQETINLYENSLKANELRLKAGDIASSDLARMKIEVLRAQNDLQQAIANRQLAQSNLAYFIGQERFAEQVFAVDAFPNIESVNTIKSKNIDDDLTNHRPDLLAADSRLKQAEDNRKLAESLKTRDITIGVQYERYPGQGLGNGENTFGAAVTIPLFTNYQYQGEIAKAESLINTAQGLKAQTKAQAIGEINNAKSSLDSSIARLKRFDGEMLAEAKKSTNAAEFAYSHGAINVTDLLDARRVLRAIQLDALTAHADFAKALAAWKAAINTEENQ
ncbi:MAG: TolC family protein [Methylophilus sp.]|jgi:cobalt-zinc-cadmium efflux system outer membrane protein